MKKSKYRPCENGLYLIKVEASCRTRKGRALSGWSRHGYLVPS